MKSYFYVYKHGDQGPRVRHADLATAQDEAERLAAKLPGHPFEILRCVGVASTSKASTFWMDGEGPPEKPRYRMLDVGEYCQEGDEAQLDPLGGWTPRQYRGKQLEGMNPTRRPL